MHPDAQMYN